MTQQDNPYIAGIDHCDLNPDRKSVRILDQTQLPNRIVYKDVSTPEECWTAIKKLEVRGAPCIGIFAGYAMAVTAQPYAGLPMDEFKAKMTEISAYLNSSRPTAVNLSWALKRMEKVIADNADKTVPEVIDLMVAESIAIHEEDIAMCKAMSEYGLSLLKDGDGLLTHCNAGPLALSKYGSGLGPILLGNERGMTFHVYSDETRPLLQGARLTSFELQKAGVDVTLICDNMASIVMKNGWINACLVGCDRVAANGDVANKIGTSGVAILAKHYGIPFYVLGPYSTIDMNCPTGEDIKIEQRDPDEIKKMWYAEPMALEEVKCYNPAFDVTDHELITAIITDKGIVYPPYDINFKKLFANE